MFGFAPTSYAQLGQAGGEREKSHSNGSSSRSAGGGGGPADLESGGQDSDGMIAGPPMGGESGRVQVPIGMVNDTRFMRQWQGLALAGFTLVQVGMFMGICVLCLMLNGYARVLVVALAGGAWLAVLLFNLRMAGRPRKIIQSFLQTKRKTRLSPPPKLGSVVVVRGAVSLLQEELLSTEFHNVPGLVLVESSLRSYHPGVKRTEAWTEHVRQTRAVDFRITDAQTGSSAIVRAFAASETGCATPLVYMSTEVPLSTAPPLSLSPRDAGEGPGSKKEDLGPRVVDTSAKKKAAARSAMTAPQLMVCKGYIRQGQVITVMGELAEVPGSPELYIAPLTKPHNIAKLLLYKHFLPFFFPTWVGGLVLSDQRGLLSS